MKYKLIVCAGGDFHTREFANVVENLDEAAERAEELRKQYQDDYPDVQVDCYPYNEDIRYPYDDYRFWTRDCFGDCGWHWMKVSDHGTRLYDYLP